MIKEVNAKEVKDLLTKAIKNRDYSTTWHLPLAEINGKTWALVAAWMDYENTDDWQVYAKLAYLPEHSLMAEYDVDWIMPYDEKSGEVDDTELTVGIGDVADIDVEWFLSEWERLKKEYITPDGDRA